MIQRAGEVVLRPLRVEQVERHAADVHAPDLRRDLHLAHRHGHGQRRAVVAGHERGGQPLGIGVDPVLVLPAAGVDALAEVALPVHQTDGDERQRPVGRLLEDVARERAEAAGVDGQRAVDAELRAEVGDRVLGARRAGAGPLEVVAHGGLDRGDPLEQRAVARGAVERLRSPPRRAAGPGSRRSAPSARGRSRRTARGRRASTTSDSCRRGVRARPAAAGTRAASASAARVRSSCPAVIDAA